MSSVTFLILSALVLWAGYKFYGGFFGKLLGIDPGKKTPAHTKFDGLDYVPARHWLVLFGHHFASIAGAGPIVGPVLAVSFWGWSPSVLFVLLGTIFIGGVHDLGALLVSVRHGGRSTADSAEFLISKKAKVIFSWFVFLSLIVIVAVFAYFSAKTFVVEPKIVVPSLGMVVVAVFVGILIYKLRINLVMATAIGLLSLVGLVVLGQRLPIAIAGENGMMIWCIVLLAYAFIASTLPVNILLQPRDYLSSFLLFFGISAGVIGIITSRPSFTTPAFIGWNSSEGALWPMLFVTIACGAISGFHSLVSSGTTSKQLSTERSAKRIGSGGMGTEGFLAVIVIIAVAAGFSGIDALRSSMSKGGPVNAFGEGFGFITRFVLGNYGKFIAVIILNGFILTTLDSATRIARYILQELFKGINIYLATFIIVILSACIALTGEWTKIWPIFGSANQLVAALTLIVITSWLLVNSKRIIYTLIPAVFMLITTVGALLWQLKQFISQKNLILIGIDIALLVLAAGMLLEVIEWARRRIKKA